MRQFQCEAYISLAKTACRHFYTEAIQSRMKIDQTWSITHTKANISNMLYRRTIDT